MSDPATGSLLDRARLVVTLALVVSVLGAALAVIGIVKLFDNSGSSNHATGVTAADANAAQTALDDGGQLAVDFTSFNYKTLNQDFANTAKHATGTFAKTYLAQSNVIAPSLKKVKAAATSQVVATGLQAFSPLKNTATVLVALNVTTKNTKAPAGTVQYFRMQVAMVRQNGVWLASGVSPQ